MKTTLEMLQDRLLILPDPEIRKEMSDGGILLPTVQVEQPLRGTVLESGPGRIEDGSFIPNVLQVGDRILFGRYGYDTIMVDGVQLYIVLERDVKARIYEVQE